MWLINAIRHLLTRRARQRAAIEAASRAEQLRQYREAVIRRSQYDAALRQAGITGTPQWLTARTGEYPTWPVRR